MSYCFKPQKTVPKEIRRIAAAQIRSALKQLESEVGKDRGERVHGARKDLKKLRALLRLIQCDLSSDVFKQENLAFRDAGRKLSATRDAHVLLATLKKLQEQEGESEADYAPALAQIAEHLSAAVGEMRDSTGDVCTDAAAILRPSLNRVKDWPVNKIEPEDLCRGLKYNYRCGRKGNKRARKKSSPENLHEWRKRVKDLWYHLEIMQAIWPELLKPLAKQTKLLSEYLGDAHDLDLLAETIQSLESCGDKDKVIELIGTKRASLEEAVLLLGDRLYAEKPGALSRRLLVYWQVAAIGVSD